MALNIRTEQVGLEESVARASARINRRGIPIKIRASDFTQPLGKITQKADEFTKSLEASNARVIAFGASAAIIGGVTRGFSELVIQAVKVQKVLTDINVVLGTTSQNLAKFGDNLFNVARNTAQTLEVAAEAALEFSRQGLSMEETLKRTNDALILTRLTGLQAADSVKGLTAAVNGFADAGLTTTQIINKLAAVDVKFAVGADDLINALARAGAVAQDAGVNFDQLVGAVTSAQQITARGGAVIGNSFKTIFTRIQRSSTLDALEDLGVAVRDIRGNTLPALRVLKNLSDSYDALGSSTKAAVAEQVGGVFQINVLKAALKDLNRENSLYAQATQISNNATDQAQKKNEQLQKTISSLAIQTNLTIQELAANLGDLALSPGIATLLDAINTFGEGLNNVFGKNAEGIGATIGQSIVKGIGAAITGPGVVVAVAIFAKLFANALKFAKSSIKDILGIVNLKDKERNLQEAIVEAMHRNKDLALELQSVAGNKAKQEEIILNRVKEQTAYLKEQKAIAAAVTPGLVRRGVAPDLTMSKSKNASAGFIPNYASQNWQAGSSGGVTPYERLKEQGMAIKSGYAPGPVKKMNISGIGSVVYNGNESVEMIPGLSQPAIMPPRGSRAANIYGSAFKSRHGFNPYSRGSANNSTYSHGFIPNFARAVQSGTMLNLPSARMMIQHPTERGWKRMEAPIINVKNNSKRLDHMFDILEGLGITALSRKFYFANQDPRGGTSGGKKVSKNRQFGFSNKVYGGLYEQGIYGNKLGNMKQKGFLRTDSTTYTIKGKKAIPSKGQGDDQAVVDFVRKGRLPLEAKLEYNPANLLGKSVFQASDRSIENFLQSRGASVSDIQGIRNIKDQRALRSMQSMRGFKNASIEDAINMGFAGGFIPSFADMRSRQQKIRDVLADPANKNVRFKGGAMTTKTFNTKARGGMFHSMYVESYLNTGNQSDLDYLVSVGYNKQELMALRRHKQNGGKVRVHASGFIPNFASPLQDALNRESAAGIPKSMMRVESDPSLVSSMNPMGLGVTNKIDEPNGIGQGIRRSKTMGIDPRFHGSSNNATYSQGMIPNYAETQRRAAGIRNVRPKNSEGGPGIGMLFGVTTAAYALEGALSSLEGQTGKNVKMMTSMAQGLAQFALVREAFSTILPRVNSFGKLGKVLGKIGPLGAAAAAIVPIFNGLKENTALLDGPMDTLRKSSEKTSKAVEALANAVTTAQEIESSRNDLNKLSLSSEARTYKGQMKSLELRIKLQKEHSNLSKQSAMLAKNLSLSAQEVKTMTSGTAEGMLKLQEAQLKYQQQLTAIDLTSAIVASLNKGLFNFEGVDQNARDIGVMQTAGMLASSGDPDAIGNTIQSLQKFSRAKIGGQRRNAVSNPTELNKIVAQSISSGDVAGSSVMNSLLESLGGAGLKDAQKIAGDIAKVLSDLQPAEEDKLKQTKIDLEYGRETNKRRAQILNAIKREESIFKMGLELLSAESNLRQKTLSLQAQQVDAMSLATKAMQVEAEMKAKRLDLEDDYLRKNQTANNNALQASKDFAAKIFGDKNNPFQASESLTADAQVSTQRGSLPLVLTTTLTGGAAFDENLKRAMEAMPELENVLNDNVKNLDRANVLILEYLNGFTDNIALQKTLEQLQKIGIIPKEKDIQSVLEDINTSKANQLKHNEDMFGNGVKQLMLDEDILEITKGTLESRKSVLASQLSDKNFATKRLKVIRENYALQLTNSKIDRNKLDVDIEFLKTRKGIEEASAAEFETKMLSLDQTKKTLMIETAILEDKQRLQQLISEEVSQEEQKAVNQRTRESATFATKKSTGFFGREGARGVAANRETMDADIDRLKGQRAVYMSDNNSGRTAEVELEIAQKQKELNFEMNQGSLFADSLAVKIAEANVQLERFGETLANTTFDAVKDGFKGMLSDLSDSTKSVGDSILGFFGGVANKIHEALIDRAATQITAGIFEMTGMSSGMNSGGIISRYSNGGSTRSVPAMLTAGEYVVRKKVVDRLGKGSLDKINQNGSLEDLYSQPNQDNFDLLNDGGIIAPPIIRLRDGGSMDNYLKMRGRDIEKSTSSEKLVTDEGIAQNLNQSPSQGITINPLSLKLKEGGSIESFIKKRNKGEDRISQNERSVVDGQIINNFTNTLAKFFGGLVRMNMGGVLKDSLSSSSEDSAMTKIIKGGGYLAGAGLAAYQGRSGSGAQGPSAPKAPQSLNTRSALNIDPTSTMMSARFRSKDQYTKDYGNYLLAKYQFDVDQQNSKVKSRANLIQSIGGAASIAGGMYLGNRMFNPTPNTVTQSQMNLANRIDPSQDSFLSQRNISSSSSSLSNNYNHSAQSQSFLNNYKSELSHDYAPYFHGGVVNSPYSYFNRGGSVGGAYSNSSSIISSSSNAHSVYLNKGGHVYSSVNSPTVNRMSSGGKVFGPNGIDKVGPVMLDRGEYVIKASSVNKVEKQFPGFFDQLNSMKMNEGGIVEPSQTPTVNSSETNNTSSSSSNVTVNINIAPNGSTSVDGGGPDQQAMATRIKDAVVGVIAEEKRVGGILRGN